MKLYGFEMNWQAVSNRLDELCTTQTAREAMAQLYPCGGTPKALFLGRGLAVRGEEICPLLILRARIGLEDGAPRVLPAEDRYHLCADTLHEVFGVDHDTLRSMEDMLGEGTAPETLPTMLAVWGRLLCGYCEVQAEQAVILTGTKVCTGAAVPIEDVGVQSPAAWMRTAARRAASGSRMLLTGRNADRLRALRGMLPDEMPVLCGWDGPQETMAFAARILADMEQMDALDKSAHAACARADQTHEQLQGARTAVDEARAVWDAGTPDPEQQRWEQLLPDQIPAGQPFPLTDAQLALLCNAEEPEELPIDTLEQFAADWQACGAQYAEAPVRLDGRRAALHIGALLLGEGGPELPAEAVEVLLQLSRRYGALEQENWLFDVLHCRNRAQLALYQSLEHALSEAAEWYESRRMLLEGHKVTYKGDIDARGAALEVLLKLERKCAVAEAGEPYSMNEVGKRLAVRRAAFRHQTLVDDALPETEEACRIARAGIEMKARMRAVKTAWSSLLGDFDRKAADCASLASLLRLCLSWSSCGFAIRADELPLTAETTEIIRGACALAQKHMALCEAMELAPVSAEQLDAARRLDTEEYHLERERVAWIEIEQLRAEKAQAIEAVRVAAPLWAAQLERGVKPVAEMAMIWDWKRAKSRNTQDIGVLLAREAALTARYDEEILTACALRVRVQTARRASADPLAYAALNRAARGDSEAIALADYAPFCFAGDWDGFDEVMIDRAGFTQAQLVQQASLGIHAFALAVEEIRTPETIFASTDWTMGYRRAAESLVRGRMSDRAARVWWAADAEYTPENQIWKLAERGLDRGKTVAVVAPDPESVRGVLLEHILPCLLLSGSLYCGGEEILASRRFDTVIACPGLTADQLTAVAHGSLGAGELWVLEADRIGADWGRQSVLSTWQSTAVSETHPGRAAEVARVLHEMCGWETAGLAGGLEVRTGDSAVWLALLEDGETYPLTAAERAGMYESGWQLFGLHLQEYHASPRAALEKLRKQIGAHIEA